MWYWISLVILTICAAVILAIGAIEILPLRRCPVCWKRCGWWKVPINRKVVWCRARDDFYFAVRGIGDFAWWVRY